MKFHLSGGGFPNGSRDDCALYAAALQTAIGVAKRWGLSAKDIDRLIRKKITNQ